MFLKIQFENETPIYEQLRNQIVQGIATGELKEGESMPSVRQLASDIGINLHTVNKTYTILKNEGFLTIHRRKNVIVNSYESMKSINITNKITNSFVPLIAESICRGMSLEELNDIVKNVYNNLKNNEVVE